MFLSLVRKGLFAEYISLTWMAVETVVSIGAGLLAGSLSLMAFGGDSVIERINQTVFLQLTGPLRSAKQTEPSSHDIG